MERQQITLLKPLRDYTFKFGDIIKGAIARYEQAGQEVPMNWVAEGVGLIRELISHKAEWTS